MNVLKNTNIFKKLIIIIIAIMLFSFAIPKQAYAAIDISGSVSSFLFWIERGVIKVVNNIFCDDIHAYQYVKDGEEGKTTVYISPETIIKGKFALLDPNIFKDITNSESSDDPANDEYYDTHDTNEGSVADDTGVSIASLIEGRSELRDTIAGWYYALRNFALIALLSILVYVAIRMIISTVSQDKAKYKTMLKDWLVAICLVMVMHYIMIGALNITTTIVDAIGTTGQNSNTMQELMLKIQNINDSEEDDHEYEDPETGEIYTIGDAFAYELVLLGVIGYTIIFAFKYLIRMMTIIFLILVAPITAITYPIDKISDGKAQAFNTWLQEFIYQVIIQPFHLLIYVVLIGSAATLANTNVFYSIMCFAVMMPAEKFIKQMFGFKDKLSSPLGAFAGGALASQLINGIKSAGGKSAKADGGDKGNSGGSDDLPRTTDTVNLPGTEGDSNDPIDPRTNQNTQEERESESYRDRTQIEDSTPEPLEDGENEDDFVDETEVEDDSIAYDETPKLEGNEDEETEVLSENTNQDDITETEDEPKDEGEEPNKPSESTPSENSIPEDTTKEENKRGFIKNTWDKAKNSKAAKAAGGRMSRNFMKKYGTTKVKGIAAGMAKKGLNKAYTGSKNTGRKVIRGATTLLGTGAGYLIGAMFNKGKEGAAFGGMIGNKFGTAVTNTTDKAMDKIEGYAGDIYNAYEDHSKDKKKREFKQDENNIKLARMNYKKRHGEDPIGNKLNEELEKMYMMSSHGVKQDQYNDVLSDYEMYKDQDGDYKLDESEAMDTAMYSAIEAQAYSAKDFKDEKTMKQAQEELYKQYEPDILAGKIKQEDAEEKVRQILLGAARMKGVKNPPLQRTQEAEMTIDTPPLSLRMPEFLGISESEMTEQTVETVTRLTATLETAGYSPEQIETLARNTADSRINTAGVITNFENKVELAVEYVKDPTAKHEAEKLVRGTNPGGKAPKAQVQGEVRERFILKDTFKVQKESDVSAMRDLEIEHFDVKTEKTQIQLAREIARNNGNALKEKNSTEVSKIKKNIMKKIKTGSNVSEDKAAEDAENTVNLAGAYFEAGKF